MASGVRVVGGSGEAPDDRGDARGAADAEPVDGDVVARGGEHVSAETSPQVATRHRDPGPRQRNAAPRRRAGVAALAALAVLGIAGTIGFGIAWEGLQSTQSGESQARAAARSFLVDLTNFNAKTVDADFSAVSSMATGAFATQAGKFFNSAIRQDLQKALASSRGQIRALYVQSYGDGQAAVYSVVDQLYVNDKLTSPQTDVLRIVVDLSQMSGRWKVADVTVLQGPTLGSATSPSSSAAGG